MNVVTSAITTSIVKSCVEITPELEPDVEDDQLGQPARVHQRADRGRVAQAEAAVAGGEHRADQLADDRDGDQHERDAHSIGPVERVDLGPQAGDDEEERQQDDARRSSRSAR